MQARLAALQPPVLADRRLGQRAARLDGEQRERPQRLVLARRRRVEPRAAGSRARRGRTPAGSSSGRRSRARRDPRAPRAPSSPASSSTSRRAAAALEVARAERALGADPLEHRLDEVAVLAQRAVVRAPVARALHHARGSAARARSGAGTPRAPSTRRCAPRGAARSTASSGYAPIRAESVSRCARSTVEIESSCTADSRRIAASTSSRVARRNRGAKPLLRDDEPPDRGDGHDRPGACASRGARGSRAGRSA